MRLFDVELEYQNCKQMNKLQESITEIILEVCRLLRVPLEVAHLALWFLHCQARIVGYHRFDRYIYSSAAILIGCKLGETIRSALDILKYLRIYIRQKKAFSSLDSEERISKLLKKVYEAEINIMINVGFDFDIEIGLSYLPEMKKHVKDEGLLEHVRKALTSLYRTDVVIYFPPRDIAICALQIVMRSERMSVGLADYGEELTRKLNSAEIKQIKSLYLEKWEVNDVPEYKYL